MALTQKYIIRIDFGDIMWFDNIKCCNCGANGLVEIGENTCPVCGMSGSLAWKDGEPKEVDYYYLPNENLKMVVYTNGK